MRQSIHEIKDDIQATIEIYFRDMIWTINDSFALSNWEVDEADKKKLYHIIFEAEAKTIEAVRNAINETSNIMNEWDFESGKEEGWKEATEQLTNRIKQTLRIK